MIQLYETDAQGACSPKPHILFCHVSSSMKIMKVYRHYIGLARLHRYTVCV